MNTEAEHKAQSLHRVRTIKSLISDAQKSAIDEILQGEEGLYMAKLLLDIYEIWERMPVTNETENQGSAAKAQLHYFLGGCDWWIIEKDIDTDHQGQIQAFGIADLGFNCRELGYISIPEILSVGAELDFHYKPQSIAELIRHTN